MNAIRLCNREITSEEYTQVKSGFDQHTLEQGVVVQHADRFTRVAESDDRFIGCASGLAYFNAQQYANWFYLTDLFVEKSYRHQGLGSALLQSLEEQVTSLGIGHIWTWTAGYEAPGFYHKMGYRIFMEMAGWYSDGSSRVGLSKQLC